MSVCSAPGCARGALRLLAHRSLCIPARQLGGLSWVSLHGAQRCPVTRMYTRVAGCIPHTPFASLTLPTLAYSTPGHTEGRTLLNTPVGTLHDIGCHWQVSVQVVGMQAGQEGAVCLGRPLGAPGSSLRLGRAALCSLRVGALEEKAGLCRGPAWPAWPRLPGPSQGTLGATLEPCGL